MIHLLAQTTQPDGLTWLSRFNEALSVFVTVTLPLIALLVAGIIALWVKVRDVSRKTDTAVVDAAKAKTAAFANTEHVAAVSRKVDENAVAQSVETTEKIKLAMSTPPVVIVPTNGGQPPTPTTEQITEALKEQKP